MTIIYFCRGLPFSESFQYWLFRRIASTYGYTVAIVPYPDDPGLIYSVIHDFFHTKDTKNSIILGHSFGAPIAMQFNRLFEFAMCVVVNPYFGTFFDGKRLPDVLDVCALFTTLDPFVMGRSEFKRFTTYCTWCYYNIADARKYLDTSCGVQLIYNDTDPYCCNEAVRGAWMGQMIALPILHPAFFTVWSCTQILEVVGGRRVASVASVVGGPASLVTLRLA